MNVRYLIVGAYALGVHGRPRATGDLDVWVDATPDNARRVMRALEQFGAPLRQVEAADFSRPGIVFQMGLPPVRIDVLTELSGGRSRRHGRTVFAPTSVRSVWTCSVGTPSSRTSAPPGVRETSETSPFSASRTLVRRWIEQGWSRAIERVWSRVCLAERMIGFRALRVRQPLGHLKEE
jgi:hypothetical protein